MAQAAYRVLPYGCFHGPFRMPGNQKWSTLPTNAGHAWRCNLRQTDGSALRRKQGGTGVECREGGEGSVTQSSERHGASRTTPGYSESAACVGD